MPTPDLDERFRRWLKLIAEMHDGANFTANQTISWTPLRKPLSECSIALVSTTGVHWHDWSGRGGALRLHGLYPGRALAA